MQLSYDDAQKHRNDNIKSYKELWAFGEVLNGKCLDVGCYHGYMWDYAPPGIEIYGINIVEEDCTIASERAKKIVNVKEVKMGAREDIPYGDNFFDVIYCKQTLEHSYNLDKALNEMKRVLKEGGKFLVEVPLNLGFDPAHISDREGSLDEKEKYWLSWIAKYYHIE